MSLQPASTEAAYEPLVIFALGNDMYREQEFKAWAADRGLDYAPVKGCYKGQTENSFVIRESNWNDVRPLCIGEESVLLLSPRFRNGKMYGDRLASLLYLWTEHRVVYPTWLEEIGLFQVASRKEALRSDGWTYDPVTEAYFVVNPNTREA
jgi:hypothetical protein